MALDQQEEFLLSAAALPLPADVAAEVFSRLPATDLAGDTSLVSRAFRAAARSALRRRPRCPVLVVYLQNRRNHSISAVHSFDPLSSSWSSLPLPKLPAAISSPLLGGHSVVSAVSISSLLFSVNNLNWFAAPAPAIWRRDPVVAVVGDRIVIAGGGDSIFDFEPCAVEVFSVGERAWKCCDPMPAVLKGSASATWLSAAAADSKLFVLERCSGRTAAFDPAAGEWGPPFFLRPDPTAVTSAISSTSGGKLVLAGVTADGRVRLWEVKVKSEAVEHVKEIGVMPAELAEMVGVKDEGFGGGMFAAIGVLAGGDWVYIYKYERCDGVAVCELTKERTVLRWHSVAVPEELSGNAVAHRAVLSCTTVGVSRPHISL